MGRIARWTAGLGVAAVLACVAAASAQETTRSAATTTGAGIVVPAIQEWTSTGIVVRRGERMSFNTTGEIQLSGDAADIAGAAGSKAARRSANAPLPRILVGAVIGRIDNGRPFAIGDRTSIQMPESGRLSLGINDDHLADNSGEFRVEISRGRP